MDLKICEISKQSQMASLAICIVLIYLDSIVDSVITS